MVENLLKELHDAFCKCKGNDGYDEIPEEVCAGCILKDIPVDVPHEGYESGVTERDVCFILMHGDIDNADFKLRGYVGGM